MREPDVIERLLREKPRLHYVSVDTAKEMADLGYKYEPGPISLAVFPEVIRYLAKTIRSDHLTIETGAGHTTVALAALAKHHICIVDADPESHALITQYLDEVGIPRDKVTFILEPSDTALPKLSVPEKLDFAFIDGCHGYPFPSLDWHYIDPHLRVGGIFGFDNTEIRAIREHCEFLEENQSYRLLERIFTPAEGVDYGTNFYVKVRDEGREWLCQPYNQRLREYQTPLIGRLKSKARNMIQLMNR